MSVDTYISGLERVNNLLNIINKKGDYDETQKYLDHRLGIAKARGDYNDMLVYSALNQIVSTRNYTRNRRR